MPSWLTPLESDRGTRTTDDAPILPYEHGVPVSSDNAVQAPTERPPAPGDQRASVARQLTNLSEMMSNLMVREEEPHHLGAASLGGEAIQLWWSEQKNHITWALPV